MTMHYTRDGDATKIADMGDQHLQNTIHLLERRAKEGVIVRTGGAGVSADEYWYDEEIVYGEDALDVLNYSEYVTELQRRKGG